MQANRIETTHPPCQAVQQKVQNPLKTCCLAHLLSKKEKYPEIISQILATLFRLQVSSGCSALGISLTGERWKSLYNHKWIQVQQGLVKGRQWSTAT